MSVAIPFRRLAKLPRLALGALCLLPAAAHAHDARPLAVTLLETAHDVYRVAITVPPTLEAANAPGMIWPEACTVRDTAELASEPSTPSVAACPGGLAGRTIRISYPLFNPALTTLFRLELADGTRRSAVLPPDELAWTVPVEPSWTNVARGYAALGIEHIWLGFDHLLFVAGLMVLARTRRRVLLAITGFTAAHSITLSLAALGVVRVPVPPIEALIALSIVFLARELVLHDASSFGHRYPVALSFAFGLLHGFGFAGALGAIGLPRAEVVTGLVAFNVGVELGQIAFIAALLAGWLAWRRIVRGLGTAGFAPGPSLQQRAGYVLGVPAAFWTIERTLTAFVA